MNTSENQKRGPLDKWPVLSIMETEQLPVYYGSQQL